MRKTDTIVVPNWGLRDDGKMFFITEMSAAQAEKWAARLFLALKGTSAAVPYEVERLGMVGVAIRGLNAVLAADVRWIDLEPLLDEMFTCVQCIRDRNHPTTTTALLPDDIEEVQTRAWIRSEILRVHTGFSAADAFSTLLSTIAASAGLQNTSTSPSASEP